jgi:hypothetical protein
METPPSGLTPVKEIIGSFCAFEKKGKRNRIYKSRSILILSMCILLI